MKQHSDYITHINNDEDLVYLKSKHFPVNMRLFATSPEYKAIILQQCEYIRDLCLSQKEGYKKPHGMSSANAGLAFNIIGIAKNRNTDKEFCEIMINPVIITRSKDTIKSFSNCGSLTLQNPIEIERNAGIVVGYYTENGNYREKAFNRETGCLTVQHEIDHNLGILITDYKN
jgi:peptide deformylase